MPPFARSIANVPTIESVQTPKESRFKFVDTKIIVMMMRPMLVRMGWIRD